MEFANKAYGQAVELGKSMTPGARITAVILVVATVASLAWLYQERAADSHEYLMGGERFTAGQLREMQAAFGKAGLEAQLDGMRIKVPRGQESKYMAALADADALPAEFGQYMQKAVSSNGLLRLPHGQQEAAWRVAKQKELQLIVSGMRGIERAAVQIDEETVDDFPRTKKSVTASVTVHPQDGQMIDERTVHTIKQLLASSVAGLKPDAVTVVDTSTNRSYGGTDANSAAAAGDDYADLKKRHELQWQQAISHVLEYIPGVLVSTNVELGVDTAKDGRRESAPRRVSVSIAVPGTHYLEVWRRENRSAEAASREPQDEALSEIESRERQKIEQLVGNLLPGRDSGATRQVAISTFYPPIGATGRAELREKAIEWITANWKIVSLVGCSLVGLLLLRSITRSMRAGVPRTVAVPVDAPATLSLVTDSGQQAEVMEPGGPAARRSAGRANLAGELAEVVRQDPDAAVSVLRSWIGNAS
jgi:flagellar biosynthesis/type III secretory pathway M-ring protein FliF/YscJ